MVQVFRRGMVYDWKGPRNFLEEQETQQFEGWGRFGKAERSKQSTPGEGNDLEQMGCKKEMFKPGTEDRPAR